MFLFRPQGQPFPFGRGHRAHSRWGVPSHFVGEHLSKADGNIFVAKGEYWRFAAGGVGGQSGAAPDLDVSQGSVYWLFGDGLGHRGFWTPDDTIIGVYGDGIFEQGERRCQPVRGGEIRRGQNVDFLLSSGRRAGRRQSIVSKVKRIHLKMELVAVSRLSLC